jgi:hypothetical protein
VAISNGYCSLAQVKAALRISDTTDDTLLEGAIEGASRMIDTYCARSFYSSGTATRVYAATSADFIDVDDFQSSTITLETASSDYGVYDVTWASTDYQLEPPNGIVDGVAWAYTRLRAVGDYQFPVVGAGKEVRVRLRANFGWATIPKQVEQAAIIQSSRVFKRYDSPLGVLGFGDIGAIRVSRFLDPDVQQMLDPYRRVQQVG